MLARRVALLSGLVLAAAVAAGAEQPPVFSIRPAAGEIRLDGELSDPGWQGAAALDAFVETNPGDNVAAKAATVALVTYDGRHLYVGLRCDDPEPARIRAPFVERDQVVGTDDNVAIFLDTRNDGRSAVELRVSPRGQQADGVFNDASGNEDFAPDFFYDTAARITERGWRATRRSRPSTRARSRRPTGAGAPPASGADRRTRCWRRTTTAAAA
jgi:hypothetical protein